MRAGLTHVGEGRSPVLTVDGLVDPAALVAAATRLAPFPPARGNAYPGLRRHIGPGDAAAARLARETLRALVPAINGAFAADGFDLVEASFSIVTVAGADLTPVQRAPHFDSTDPNYLAVLHYLSGVDGSGTAFYRHRASGVERVGEDNRARYLAVAAGEAPQWDGYVDGTNAWYEQIGAVAARPGRLIAYPGSLLHSGLIPPTLALSPDPGRGRLTANYFLRIRPARSGG